MRGDDADAKLTVTAPLVFTSVMLCTSVIASNSRLFASKPLGYVVSSSLRPASLIER